MYQSSTILKPSLAPDEYWRSAHHERERDAVFGTSWHPVGAASSIAKNGDYLSAEILDVPVIVRNFSGELVAMRNVCAHRQCRLVSAAQGHSERLKCPFHGWEYGADGRTRKIPAAGNFPGFDRETHRLDQFAVARCGDVIFVRLSDHGPALPEWMGPLHDRFSKWLDSARWRLSLKRKIPYHANWKIPVETALESYHIPEVHPKTFSEDPGEALSEHEFTPHSSSFYTAFLTPRWIDRLLKTTERWVLGRLGVPFHARYEHHHVFPNLLVSHTDSLTVMQAVLPNGPQSSTGVVFQFGCRSEQGSGPRELLARGWGKFTAALTAHILMEDAAIYPELQAGVQGGARLGVLGRCEERLDAFQRHVRARLDDPASVQPLAWSSACASALRDCSGEALDVAARPGAGTGPSAAS